MDPDCRFEICSFRSARPSPPSVGDSMRRMALRHSRVRSGPLGYVTLLGTFLFAILFFGSACALAQSATSDDGPLQPSSDVSKPHFIDNDAIVKMSKAGLDDAVIIQTIQTQPGHYDTSPDNLISLKNAGVSQQVIAAMQARSAGLVFHAKDKIDPAPLSAGRRRDRRLLPGQEDRRVASAEDRARSVQVRRLAQEHRHRRHRQAGHERPSRWRSSLRSPCPPASTSSSTRPPARRPRSTTFSASASTPTAANSASRPAASSTPRSGSQRDEIEFHPHKIAPQMYIFTVPADIEKGEYGVLPPGSSNVPGLSNAGKIFTFSIRE